MSSKNKHLFSSIIVTLLILAALFVFLGFTISLIIAVLVGLGTYWFFSTKDSAQTTPEPNEAELSATEIGHQSLLLANLELRKNIMSSSLRDDYESLIDQLMALLPIVNGASGEKTHSNELSWVINRMATEYLPNKSIVPYLKLSDTERLDESVISEVSDNINAMKKELNEVQEMVLKKNTSEFSKKAQFLKQRFAD